MKFKKFSKTKACPVCQSTEVYRLKRQGWATRLVCKFSDYRPHWCSTCDTFFYAPKGPKTFRMESAYGISHHSNGPGKRPHADGLTR